MWLKIKILLWKSLHLRKRYWLNTIIETIVPCLIFIYMCSIDLLKKDSAYISKIPNTKQIILKELVPYMQNISIYYAPRNKETELVMDIFSHNFHLTTATENESEMVANIQDQMRSNTNTFLEYFCGVVFEKITKSHDLRYKLRCNKNIYTYKFTDKLFQYEIPGPNLLWKFPNVHYSNYKVLIYYTTIQLLIDKAYINWSICDNNTFDINDYNLNIKTYPYADYIPIANFQTLFQKILPSFTLLGFLFMWSYTIHRISEENESGVKELMKMIGLESWMIWAGWILNNFFTYALSVSMIVYLLCFDKFTDISLFLYYTNPLLLCLFLVMYMVTGCFFCFAISSLFNNPLISIMVGDFAWFLSYVLPWFMINYSYTNIHIPRILMLLPNVSVINAYNTIAFLESQGLGLQLSTLFTTRKDDDYISFGFILFMLIIDCLLYGFIAWYFNSEMKERHGIKIIFNIMHKWSNKKNESIPMMSIDNINSRFFEDLPNKNDIGIRVNNLHKRFGKTRVVNGLNLDLYEGQITVLLGHNGAGKTTTMSIIAGLLCPSYGSVHFNGKYLFRTIGRLRENVGFCPQHNAFFSYLTTLEHLIFFGMLKGMKLEHAKLMGLHLLKILNISQKKDEVVSSLSGGMKRKLSLAIALIGSPEILILDEPTSGMDPESRREVWDLLLSFRGNKTILITTQLMEEADVLGDRIAIMDHGKLKCYGTSLFLKKAYGAGYNLTILKDESFPESNIIAAIKRIIPETEIKSSQKVQIVINIQKENTDKFPDLFEMLENNRIGFSIKGMGISFTKMDEVFLSSCTTVGDEPKNKPPKNDRIQASTPKYISGIYLMINQFKILFKKKMLYTYRRWLFTLFIYGLVPYTLGILSVKCIFYYQQNQFFNRPIEISLSMYPDSSVYYRKGDNFTENLEPTFVSISEANQFIVHKISTNNDIIDELLKLCEQNQYYYRHNLMIAGDFNYTNVTLFINSVATYSINIAVNLYTNALLRKMSDNNKSNISILYEPILLDDEILDRDHIYAAEVCIIICTTCLSYLIGYFISLPFEERVSSIKQLQMMTKLSPIMYWATCFIWDYICYIIVVIYILTTIYFIDVTHTFTNPQELCILLTLLLTYGWSSILYAYMFSFFNKTLHTSVLLFILINLIIDIFVIISMASELFGHLHGNNTFWHIIQYTMLFIPQISYPLCIHDFLETAVYIANSPRNRTSSRGYFEFKSKKNEHGILMETLFLLFSSVVYIILILLFEYKVFSHLYQFGFNTIVGTYVGYKDGNEDTDVNIERINVDTEKHCSNDKLSSILVVHDIVKRYSFKFTGVRGISFRILPGECIGLLGVNGAGKSTIFRILTGDMFPSSGDASIHLGQLYKLRSNNKHYVSLIGYCPQTDAINGHLTGTETLELMAILRGISPLDCKKHVDKWIKLIGLDEYKDRICRTYSGGNKRKLNTAMALIGDPPVVFLDEPTSGVDPVARRNIWNILASCKRRGQTILFTSHSMDECEALCDRLTIMVDGEMKCIGNIQYLKSRYGQGFTVMVKLRSICNIRLNDLKADIEQQFTPDIMLNDEHEGLLHYHITSPKIPLSNIFSEMRTIKDKYAEIEDYIISDTTLEQIFLAFAKGEANSTATT